jgi:hypothetical protein
LNIKLTYLLAILLFFGCKSAQDTEQEKVNKILPVIIELTGIKHPDPVKVELLSRAELKKYLENLIEVYLPNEELTKRGECFSEIGLLPKGYNLKSELVSLVGDGAAALYDEHTKTIKIVSDLFAWEKEKASEGMIIAHEAAHALEDGIIDLNLQTEKGLKNIDYEYTFRAINEGVANAVMFSYRDNVPLSELNDIKNLWYRGSAAPNPANDIYYRRYVNDYWSRPYKDGCDFVEAWLKANPHKKLIDLLKDMPSTSEQILHFDKYAQRDEPTDINLSKVGDILPKNWKLYYSNTLGEFELLILFGSYPETRYDGDSLAAGWDGCKFEAYKDEDNNLILFGSSAWDTEKDAQEFCAGFNQVLNIARTARDFTVQQHQMRVDFVIGLVDKAVVGKIMKILHSPS